LRIVKQHKPELEERLETLFVPDMLLPSQYFDRTRRRVGPHGERRLMLAVLGDAVDMYRKHVGAREGPHRELFEDAERWIEDRDSSWFYSFENICDVLDLEPEWIRRGLRAWKARARREVAITVEPGPDREPAEERSAG
jgi:hypothetical protein